MQTTVIFENESVTKIKASQKGPNNVLARRKIIRTEKHGSENSKNAVSS